MPGVPGPRAFLCGLWTWGGQYWESELGVINSSHVSGSDFPGAWGLWVSKALQSGTSRSANVTPCQCPTSLQTLVLTGVPPSACKGSS
jgi:hypothetical protein